MTESPRPAWWSRSWIAVAILAAFYAALLVGARSTSLTFDEVGHVAAGHAYWRTGEYRFNPENGQLPARVAALPAVLLGVPSPPRDTREWREADLLTVAHGWLYEQGHDAAAIAFYGRAACGLFAVALAAAVWLAARRWWGPAGGLAALLVCVCNPALLANGALMTSDTAAALFLFLSVWAVASALARLTPGRVLASVAALTGLVLAKASAALILPVVAVLGLARALDGRAWPVGRGGRALTVAGGKVAAFAAVAALHALVVAGALWAAYGFRYAANAEGGRFARPWAYVLGQTRPGDLLMRVAISEGQIERLGPILEKHGVTVPYWTNEGAAALDEVIATVLTETQRRQIAALRAEPPGGLVAGTVDFLRRHEVLPEAWLYGFADVVARSKMRSAFWNGEVAMTGWRLYFPYVFLVKTPLALLALLVLAARAGFALGRQRRSAPAAGAWLGRLTAARAWPWAVFLAVYLGASVASHLNIGHRHLLPIYGPLALFVGAAFAASLPWVRRAASVLLAVLAVEAAAWFPRQLSYVNGLITPAAAHRHLVDSSIDWGQDLPALAGFTAAEAQAGRPVWLAYFGTASPAWHGVQARGLYSYFGAHRRDDTVVLIQTAPAEKVEALTETLVRVRPDYVLAATVPAGAEQAVILVKRPEALRLAGGTYVISATMLQPVCYELDGPWGAWCERHERTYQELWAEVAPLWAEDEAARRTVLARRPPQSWPAVYARFERYLMARLTAFLREREPAERIGGSLLVYRLGDAEVARMVAGPPPPLGPDQAADFLAAGR